jgi:UDP-glucose 4-epimerase
MVAPGMKRTALVTGAAGFIGSHLVDALLARKQRVVGFDNFSTGKQANLAAALARDRFTLVTGDVRDEQAVQEACRNVDVVYHLAAASSVSESMQDPRKYHDVNVTGTLNVLLAAVAAGAKRFVFTSSAAVYGSPETVPTPETAFANPLSPYGASKRAAELFCQAVGTANGLEARNLRLFNVYGPRQTAGDEGGVVSIFIQHAWTRQPLTIFGDGQQTRDLIYVDDVVEALIRAGTLPKIPSDPINIGTGRPVSIRELAEKIQRVCPIQGVEIVYRATRPGDIRHSVATTDRMHQFLRFTAQHDLQRGLETTCAQTPH